LSRSIIKDGRKKKKRKSEADGEGFLHDEEDRRPRESNDSKRFKGVETK